ncbi:MAG TPA: hypothetical protein VGK19_00260 [Capsulimonadaceae bacterium]|jgi:hypothetical protein
MNRTSFNAAALTILLATATGVQSAPRPDPFAPYGMPIGSPFMKAPAPAQKKVTVPPVRFKPPMPTPPSPKAGGPVVLAPPAPVSHETKSWSVVGIMNGAYPQALVATGQESYVIQLGDTLPDGSGKFTSMDSSSITLRSRVTKVETRVAVGSTVALPVN